MPLPESHERECIIKAKSAFDLGARTPAGENLGSLIRTGSSSPFHFIQLPENLFYGTSIATCIMVLKKNKSDNSILFINASKECVKVTNNNKLTDKNIDNILKYYEERKNIEYISSFIKYEKVVEENYNLSVNTYVELEDTREKIDIKVLNAEIEAIVKKQQVLRDNINKIINELGEI